MFRRSDQAPDIAENTQFVEAADGTSIAYRVDGEGPALVFVNGFTTSNEYWRHLRDRFEDRATLVNWDLKGHGNSEPARTEEGATVEAAVDDMRRVMDAAGIERATLLGFSFGAQLIVEAWRTMPERIAGLVPILGPFEKTFEPFLPPVVGPLFWQLFERYGPEIADPLLGFCYWASQFPLTWQLVKALGYIGDPVEFEEMQPFFEHVGRVHGRTWAHLGISAHNHSAADLLGEIDVPTLIVSGGKDLLAPAELGRRMQSKMPHAELHVVPEASHAGLLGRREEIEGRVEAFLRDHELIRA
jgi:pimeloyl-ACP methyl ester carboxylesterase